MRKYLLLIFACSCLNLIAQVNPVNIPEPFDPFYSSFDAKNYPEGTVFYGATPTANLKPWILVFVHGYNANANTWFKTFPNGDIYKQAYLAGYRCAFVNNSGFVDCATNAQIFSDEFLDIINHYPSSFGSYASYFPRMIIIGHSKGGLDVDLSLLNIFGDAAYVDVVKRIFTISSPHWGSSLANYSWYIFPLFPGIWDCPTDSIPFGNVPIQAICGDAVFNLTTQAMKNQRRAIDIISGTLSGNTYKCKFISTRGWCYTGGGSNPAYVFTGTLTSMSRFEYGYGAATPIPIRIENPLGFSGGTFPSLPSLTGMFTGALTGYLDPVLNDGAVPFQSSFRPGGIELPNSRLANYAAFDHTAVVGQNWPYINQHIQNSISTADDFDWCANFGNFYQGYDDTDGSYDQFYLPDDRSIPNKVTLSNWCTGQTTYGGPDGNNPNGSSSGSGKTTNSVENNLAPLFSSMQVITANSNERQVQKIYIPKDSTNLVGFVSKKEGENLVLNVKKVKDKSFLDKNDVEVVNADSLESESMFNSFVGLYNLEAGEYEVESHQPYVAFLNNFSSAAMLELTSNDLSGFVDESVTGEKIKFKLKINNFVNQGEYSITATFAKMMALPEAFYKLVGMDFPKIKRDTMELYFTPTAEIGVYECEIDKTLIPAMYALGISVKNTAIHFKAEIGSGYTILPTSVASLMSLSNVQLMKNNKFPLHVSTYPNPFKESTTINYYAVRGEILNLSILNIMGQVVYNSNLVASQDGSNVVTWNGTNNAGERLSGGVYTVRISKASNANKSDVAKVILVD